MPPATGWLSCFPFMAEGVGVAFMVNRLGFELHKLKMCIGFDDFRGLHPKP